MERTRKNLTKFRSWTSTVMPERIIAEEDTKRRSEHKESTTFILSMLAALAINYVGLYMLQF